MDQQVSVTAHDGKTIYGLFNQAGAEPSRSLVVLAHGLTGRVFDFIHMMAMRTFTASGYDVARISFYDGWPNARILRDCTADIHAKDLNACIEHFRPRYQNIYVAGHSYGGFAMLLANPDVNAVSFWDSTWTPAWHKEVIEIPELNCFAFNYGQENLVGRAMYDEAAHYAANPPFDLAAAFKSPAQVVLAQANEKPGRARDQIFNALAITNKELVRIEGADHQFTNGQTVEALLAATKSWFDAHL